MTEPQAGRDLAHSLLMLAVHVGMHQDTGDGVDSLLLEADQLLSEVLLLQVPGDEHLLPRGAPGRPPARPVQLAGVVAEDQSLLHLTHLPRREPPGT